MSRRISFKVYSRDAVGNPIDEERLALAFERHCTTNLGLTDSLDMLAKKIFMKFLTEAIDKSKSNPQDLTKVGVPTEVADASGESQSIGDLEAAAVPPASAAGIALADTPDASSAVADT